jgi:hypothetical protein
LSIGREIVRRRGKEEAMAHYLLSIQQPDGEPPPRAQLDEIMHNVEEFDRELKKAGAWVAAGGLTPPSAAAVIRVRGGGVLVTDGPYVESKEHLGGISIIYASSREAALEWAKKAARAIGLPIELREFARFNS